MVKYFFFTTNIYKKPNYAAILGPKEKNLEGKIDVDPEGMDVKKEEKMTTKQLSTRKIYINNLHVKRFRLGQDRMHTNENNLQYTIMEMLEVCKYFTMDKSNHKYLCKVVEE